MSELFTCQPISDWTPFGSEERWANPFRATWSDTLRLLKRELVHLDAERVVVELDLQAGQIRRDGMPRSTAKVTSPAVRLAFQSSVGPLLLTWKRARSLTHPDRHGGDRTAWDRVEQAASVLGLS